MVAVTDDEDFSDGRAGRGRPQGAVAPARGAKHRRDQQSRDDRSEEHTSELQSLRHLVCRLLLEKKNTEIKPIAVKMPSDQSINVASPALRNVARDRLRAERLHPKVSTIIPH